MYLKQVKQVVEVPCIHLRTHTIHATPYTSLHIIYLHTTHLGTHNLHNLHAYKSTSKSKSKSQVHQVHKLHPSIHPAWLTNPTYLPNLPT